MAERVGFEPDSGLTRCICNHSARYPLFQVNPSGSSRVRTAIYRLYFNTVNVAGKWAEG